MNNPYLSDDHILTHGDALLVEGARNDVFAAVFNLLDAEFGGETAGIIADLAAKTTRRLLTADLQVYDAIEAERRRIASDEFDAQQDYARNYGGDR